MFIRLYPLAHVEETSRRCIVAVEGTCYSRCRPDMKSMFLAHYKESSTVITNKPKASSESPLSNSAQIMNENLDLICYVQLHGVVISINLADVIV